MRQCVVVKIESTVAHHVLSLRVCITQTPASIMQITAENVRSQIGSQLETILLRLNILWQLQAIM